MPRYHVNKRAQNTGEHEVHLDTCRHAPEVANQHDLGEHLTCSSAVEAAKRHYTDVDGCFHCSNLCHSR